MEGTGPGGPGTMLHCSPHRQSFSHSESLRRRTWWGFTVGRDRPWSMDWMLSGTPTSPFHAGLRFPNPSVSPWWPQYPWKSLLAPHFAFCLIFIVNWAVTHLEGTLNACLWHKHGLPGALGSKVCHSFIPTFPVLTVHTEMFWRFPFSWPHPLSCPRPHLTFSILFFMPRMSMLQRSGYWFWRISFWTQLMMFIWWWGPPFATRCRRSGKERLQVSHQLR